MKLLISAVFCIVAIGEGIAQKDPKALQILDAMSAKYQKIPSFKASFKYIMENPEEDINEGFEGTVFVKGDFYKLSMEEQEMRYDGTNVWTFLEEDNEVSVSPYDPEDEDITLSNIFNIYKVGYKYLYLESRDNGKIDVIDLVPDDLEKSYFKIRLQIAAGTKDLKSFKVFDKSGSRYLYEVVTFAEDTSIKDGDFTYTEEQLKGKEFIDFR
jgi:outer membrane lipoprotein-sorting protein